jgi:hypothetical protein
VAKKNEILLSIGLEGDAEVKAKLKAVGEEGKKSLADIERSVSQAGSRLGRLSEPVDKLGRSLAPILEEAGLAGGIGRFAGLLGTLGKASIGPGIGAALSGLALHLAKVREETEKTEARLKGLGGSSGAVDKLNASARKLGVDPKSIEDDFADFQATRRRALADQSGGLSHPPGFVPPENETSPVQVFQGNRLVSGAPATEEQFFAAREALINGARLDKKSPSDAKGAISQLLKGVNSGGLTGDLVRQFGAPGALPNDANLLARVLGPAVSRGFNNSEELAKFLDQNGPIGADKVFRGLAKQAPQIAKEAGEGGLSSSFEGLTASVRRADAAFGNLVGGPLGKLIGQGADKTADLINKGADNIPGLDQQVRAAEFAPGGSQFIGPVRPEDVPKAPQSLGEVFSSDKGDLLGRIVGFIRGGESGQNNGFAGGNPFGVISDFLSKALANPAALQEKARPAEGPSALQPVPQQQSQQPADQQSSTFQRLLDNIAAQAGSLNPPNLKVEGPTSGLGIRGDAEQVGDGLKQLASVISDAVASIRNSGAGSVQKVQVAAAGGMIRWLDGGGHVSGPGTTTSDSIPAMLSDKEYVINAAASRKIGRANLDWLNAGMPGYADGGSVKGSVTALSAGDHQISYDPSTGGAYIDGVLRLPGDPLLQDPIVQAAIARSKADAGGASKRKSKSDFTGIFGGHVFDQSGSYAAGGAVGHIGNAISRAFGGRTISFPGFAAGGLAEVSGLGGLSPTVGDLAGAGGIREMHPVTIQMPGGQRVGPMLSDAEIVEALRREARDASAYSTGRSPSWRYGSGD